MSEIRFVIVTGLSGAGKSEAVRCFEDLGYFCVDNLPPALIPKFADLCEQSRGTVAKVALVMDVRGGAFFDALFEALAELKRRGFPCQVLFLEASDETLVRRFKASRRPHPLEGHSTLEGIAQERARLQPIRNRADVIVDTTHLTPRQLQRVLAQRFAGPSARMQVTVLSFGFKHGIPLDADYVFDLRFLPNPNYVPELQPLTGAEPAVAAYVFQAPVSQFLWQRLVDLVDFVLPHVAAEGRRHLVVALGCTGGRHRSVAFAERLAQHLRSQGVMVFVEHRDAAKAEPALLKEAE